MPAPKIPADDVAILARPAHRELVLYIVRNPAVSFKEIVEATGAPVASLTRALRQLELIGVVSTDSNQPLGLRRGQAPRYTADAERIRTLLDDLRTALLG